MGRKRGLLLVIVSFACLAQAKESITGCVAEDKEMGTFVLWETPGKRLPISGRLDLSDHIGHRVELQGDYLKERQSFEPTSARRVDGDCGESQTGLTADDQGMSAADTKVTQRIRKALTTDESLSTLGHNIKIITRDGLVTLRGTVDSFQEKQRIEEAAAAVAGRGKVQSELTVKSEDPEEDNDQS